MRIWFFLQRTYALLRLLLSGDFHFVGVKSPTSIGRPRDDSVHREKHGADMRATRFVGRYGLPATITVIAIVLWWVAITPSGFGAQELVALTAPGAVLALAAQWARYVLRFDELTRKKMTAAAVVGAMIMPPVIAFGIAVLSAFNRTAIIVIFVLGAWAALGGGLLAGAIDALWTDFRPKRRVRSSHRVVPAVATRRVRHTPSPLGPLPRWPESADSSRQVSSTLPPH